MSIENRIYAPFPVSVGMKVYIVPTDNEARRWNHTPYECRVTKIGRKYFYASSNAYREYKVEIDTCSHYDCDENSGCIAYQSIEEYEGELELKRKHTEIREFFNRMYSPADMSEEAITQVYNIISAEKNNKGLTPTKGNGIIYEPNTFE